jgi:tRNA U34 5-carboxymethylaminomethyl modifying GTPase MnmE/TrmE
MIGKFKTPEALWQSYQQLEKAFTQKCQQIKRMEEQNMKVYEVKIDWATNDAEDCTTEVYSTAEKARKAFNSEIVQAMQDYDVFDEETG